LPLLTDRELAVLHLLAQAQSNNAIGDALGISANTVRTHVRNVLVKLNAHSRAEAVAIAVRWGIVKGQPAGSEWAAG
jgi:LuxR family maltose regulon positive regulatory protein